MSDLGFLLGMARRHAKRILLIEKQPQLMTICHLVDAEGRNRVLGCPWADDKRGGSIEAVAGDQPEPARAIKLSDKPMAVVLDLVQPAVANGRLGARHDER